MDVYLASDGGIVQIPHALSDYDSLEGVYADVSAGTGIVSGNVLIFTEDGRELKQDVLEELWERGGQGAGSSPQVVYLFNRETFWSDPERWAAELREDVVLPPPLELSHLELSQAQHPFAVAYDHLCHLQSLFNAQAHALRIAYANLAFHLEPIITAFREFSTRADNQLDTQAKLLHGYEADMAMLPKVVVHESLFRRREKEETRRKTLVDWIHTKKMEQVRDWCQSAHSDYSKRYNTVAEEMDKLAQQSDAGRQQAEHRIVDVEQEFMEALGRVELASQQVEALMQSDTLDPRDTLQELDEAMREDVASMTQLKNDFTLDLHVHLRQIADYQVRITKFTRPMSELDHDLRQKNAFPHLERLHNLPFAYAANAVEIVHRKHFAALLQEWAVRLVEAVNVCLENEQKRRQQHKADNQLPWEIVPLEGTTAPRVDIQVAGAEGLASVTLSRKDIEDMKTSLAQLKDDPDLTFEGVDNPIPGLLEQITTLLEQLDSMSQGLNGILNHAVVAVATQEPGQIRMTDDDHEQSIAEIQRAHEAELQELKDRHDQRTTTLMTRQAELQEELVRLRTDLSEEMLGRQQATTELEEKIRELDDRGRDHDEQGDLIAALQADMTQEKNRATDLGVRLQEALLDVDGLRNAEQTLVMQVREMQEERTRLLTDLGEAQLLAQNYESELAGMKAELDATMQHLGQAQLDRDMALKNQSAEAERMMRDHIAEADGDRAVLEHQNLTLAQELETVKSGLAEKLNVAKNAAVRREDGLKAELSFTKAQLREVQRRETIMADELAVAKDSVAALSQKETHHVELAKDAVMLAGKYHESCHRLMGAIASSTTISGSLSLPPRPKSSPFAPTASADLLDSSVLARCLEAASAFEVEAFADAVLRTINLARKLSKSCKQYRELSRSKITISNFGKGDLVLFLPTRNAAVNAWAAFNISAPHHFLRVTDKIRQQLVGKDYYLARIVGTDEAVVNGDSPATNPYGLAEGLRYFSHQAEEWSPSATRPRRSVSTNVPAPPGEDRVARREVSQPAKASPSSSPPVASPAATPPPASAGTSPTVAIPPLSKVNDTPGRVASARPQAVKDDAAASVHSPQPRKSLISSTSRLGKEDTDSSSPTTTSPPLDNTDTASPTPQDPPPAPQPNPQPSQPTQPTRPTRSPIPLNLHPAQSPPPPPSSPTDPTNPMAIRRRHRPSMTSSPPSRSPGSGRPSSVASSISSPKGLPIPSSSAKGVPAAPVATSAEGSPAPSSFESGHGLLGRRLSKKSSAASLKGELGKSPLGPEGGFLSGLSISRKRNSTGGTAVDMLKRFEGGS